MHVRIDGGDRGASAASGGFGRGAELELGLELVSALLADDADAALCTLLALAGQDTGALCVGPQRRVLARSPGFRAEASAAPLDRSVSASTAAGQFTLVLPRALADDVRSALARAFRRALELAGWSPRQTASWRCAGRILDDLSVGLALVDARCELVVWNANARRALEARDGLVHGADGRSPCGELIRAALERVCLVERPSGARPYLLSAVRVTAEDAVFAEPRVALLIDDPGVEREVPAALLRELHGLTAAEARVAGAIASGVTPEEASERFGVALHTVRTQLKRAMQKTGCHRQSELVLLFARSVVRSARARA